MSDAPTRPTQTSLESKPDAGSAPPSALRAFYGRSKDLASGIFKERKPWAELFDRTAFSRPGNFAEATERLRKNGVYFRINYLIFMMVVTTVCMVLNPASLAVLAFLSLLWVYLFAVRTAPVVIGGRTFSDREKLIGLAIISVVVIFFLTGVGTILFTALGISVAAIALHACMRVPDDLFTDEAESQQSLLGFLTAPTSSAVSGLNVV
ncbi:hypothetical protein WJX74_009054 [Apatococcus lobatus]|uniref:PRA1 family protein n=2 Tax=Apatococcus TaxID=904362 RepID=A0AAW1T634_9CHLO